MKYKTRVRELDAILWNGNNFALVSEFAGGKVKYEDGYLYLHINGEWIVAPHNYYVINFAPDCFALAPKAQFEEKYEPTGTQDGSE